MALPDTHEQPVFLLNDVDLRRMGLQRIERRFQSGEWR